LVLEAATTIVDDFDPRLVRLFEQNVLRLQVAMNDPVLSLVFQSLQDLNGKPSNQPDRHPSELIVLNELIKVYAEKLERYDKMLPVNGEVLYPDDIVDIIGVMLLQVVENVQLDPSLMMKAFLVADNLHCNKLIGLVVIALQGLSERTFT
jgi:hypothetical protein